MVHASGVSCENNKVYRRCLISLAFVEKAIVHLKKPHHLPPKKVNLKHKFYYFKS